MKSLALLALGCSSAIADPPPAVDHLIVCAEPASVELDPTLPTTLARATDYWTELGYNMRFGDSACEVIVRVSDTSLTPDWGAAKAQAWLPNDRTKPCEVALRTEFWMDATSSVELKTALATHELGHVAGLADSVNPTGEIMSPIVTEAVAQAVFGEST